MIALGEDHGGGIGAALGGGLARVLGGAGSLIVGVALLLAGALLVTGASAGALLRRSGHAVRQAGTAARRSIESIEWADWSDSASSADGPEPDRAPGRPRRGGPGRRGARRSPTSLPRGRVGRAPAAAAARAGRRVDGGGRRARVPRTRGRRRVPSPRPDAPEGQPSDPGGLGRRERAHGAAARPDARPLRGRGDGRRHRSPGRASTRYELQLAPGTKVSKVAGLKDDLSYALATTEIRILAPIPGKQAVGVEVPNLAPRIVTLGDIFDDLPGDGEPARPSGSARTSRGTPSGPTSRACRTS